ncbi:MAG TPA: hypothetical protein VEB68_08975 [Croceibacterium sp.]|nr:hypothetical protein [Croceibacterium sp.]
MTNKTLLAAMAVSSMALAQPAAAATRSADSLPANGIAAPTSAERVGALTEDGDELNRRASRALIIALIALLLGGLIALMMGSKSPG